MFALIVNIFTKYIYSYMNNTAVLQFGCHRDDPLSVCVCHMIKGEILERSCNRIVQSHDFPYIYYRFKSETNLIGWNGP